MIRESNALAYSSLTDVISWDAAGLVTLKPAAEITREVAVAIKKVRSLTRTILVTDGESIEETRVEIEMHDKKGALDLLARIAGMLRKDPSARTDNVLFVLNMYFEEKSKTKEEKDGRVVSG